MVLTTRGFRCFTSEVFFQDLGSQGAEDIHSQWFISYLDYLNFVLIGEGL